MIIQELYQNVVDGNKYDLQKAAKHNEELFAAKVKACDLPMIEAKFIADNHVGCCLHYAMALIYKMRMHYIKCYLAITDEENPVTHKKTDKHASVCYLVRGQRFIADPVETVKKWDNDYYDIPIARFLKENRKIKLYDLYGEYGNQFFFGEFMEHPIEVLKLR